MFLYNMSLISFDKKTWIMIAVIAAAVLLLLLYISVHFSKGKRKGRAAERKVGKYLKKLGKKDRIRIINNAYLPLYNKACEVDHLVFGRFGVLVVETKGISGTVTGSGKNLTHTIGSKTHKFYNPQLQNKTHMDNVIHHLKKGGFENTPVNGAVVFSAKDIDFPSEIGMDLKGLEKFYNSLPDAGCNQDILYHYFIKMQVRNPLKKMWIRTRKKND
ncbi:nuclease-related domain-containing protein [Ruminococcus flavefaciens]|uniref:nuclease-related domain-containing protein n=1 Tax=Ruminococcus flavefaciens TaxID=1265 RepID=UPI0004914D56|nr:nuclease-related domain-containing protein [Ruminococcus flavefaciens]